MQPDRAQSLRAVGEEVRALSAALRVETAIGSRLLQFAKHAQSGIDAEVLSVADNARTPGYDRQARNLSGPDAAGQLVVFAHGNFIVGDGSYKCTFTASDDGGATYTVASAGGGGCASCYLCSVSSS